LSFIDSVRRSNKYLPALFQDHDFLEMYVLDYLTMFSLQIQRSAMTTTICLFNKVYSTKLLFNAVNGYQDFSRKKSIETK